MHIGQVFTPFVPSDDARAGKVPAKNRTKNERQTPKQDLRVQEAGSQPQAQPATCNQASNSASQAGSKTGRQATRNKAPVRTTRGDHESEEGSAKKVTSQTMNAAHQLGDKITNWGTTKQENMPVLNQRARQQIQPLADQLNPSPGIPSRMLTASKPRGSAHVQSRGPVGRALR